MPYAFEPHESIAYNSKRIALELLNTILEQLSDKTNNRDEAIHESRKAFKQLRALLRLLRKDLGEKFYQRENYFYRDLALKLAPMRDIFVLMEALDRALKGVENPEILLAAKKLRKELNKEYKALRKQLYEENGAVDTVVKHLEAHRLSIESWDLSSNKFAVLASGLALGYEQGQKRLIKAYKIQSSEGFHEWRKAVKNLWYHCRLLENVHPEMLSPYILELKNLSELLGDANDFAILETYLAEHQLEETLIPIIHEKRQELLLKAKKLGEALYQEKGKDFMKKMKQAWKKWQANTA